MNKSPVTLIDLSQPLYDDCPNCPVHPRVMIDIVARHDSSGEESWHMEHLSFASHSGSHIDAPLHKIKNGEAIDAIPLERFVGPARVVDLRGVEAHFPITASVLAARLPDEMDGQFALLATGWGVRRGKTPEWERESPFLTEDGAHWLVAHGARGVGIDHYSIGGSAEPANARTHTVLLSNHLLIIEELRFPEEAFTLRQPCEFWALPIHLRGGSGSPCRPVLVVRC